MGFFIRYEGNFDYSGLYRFCHDFLEGKGYDLDETGYKFKEDESEIKWSAEMDVTEYIQYKLNVEFHFYDLKKVKVDGKQIDNGRIEIIIDYTLVQDPNDLFGNKGESRKDKFVGFLGKTMQKMRAEEIAAKYEDQLQYQALRLQTEIKKFLNMYTSSNAY